MKQPFYKKNISLLIMCVIVFLWFSIYTFLWWGKDKDFGEVTAISDTQITIIDRKQQSKIFQITPNTQILHRPEMDAQVHTWDMVFVKWDYATTEINEAIHIRITPPKKSVNSQQN